MAKKIVKWSGHAPDRCDLCRVPIQNTFVDGKTNMGPWASMCPDCHDAHGVGLGTGMGQKYQKQPNGEWIKVEG